MVEDFIEDYRSLIKELDNILYYIVYKPDMFIKDVEVLVRELGL